jgi:hypothetical protein
MAGIVVPSVKDAAMAANSRTKSRRPHPEAVDGAPAPAAEQRNTASLTRNV